MRPFRPGLLAKADEIWRVRMAAMKATMARNTSIDSTRLAGWIACAGRTPSRPIEPTNPKDLSMPILAPNPFPAMQ